MQRRLAVMLRVAKTLLNLRRNMNHISQRLNTIQLKSQTLKADDIPRKVMELEKLLLENRGYIVAVGEIGLDYFSSRTRKRRRTKGGTETPLLCHGRTFSKIQSPCHHSYSQCPRGYTPMHKRIGA